VNEKQEKVLRDFNGWSDGVWTYEDLAREILRTADAYRAADAASATPTVPAPAAALAPSPDELATTHLRFADGRLQQEFLDTTNGLLWRDVPGQEDQA